MTYFINDNNESIYFDGEFLLTKQAVSFYNFKIKGDVSVNFTIPNNSENRKILGYYGFNQSNNPAFSQQSFSVTKNGNVLAKGYIVIQSDNGQELDCFFISGNTWINSLNQNIKQFDYNEYTVYPDNFIDVNRVVISSTIYPKEYGIIFPIVDWAYEGKKYQSGGQVKIKKRVYLDEWDSKDYFPEMLPVVYLHTVVSEIAKKSNIKLSGNLFDDGVYNRIVITPETADLEWPDFFVNASLTKAETIVTTSMSSGYQKVSFETQTYPSGDSPYDQINSKYTARYTGIYNVTLNWDTDTAQMYIFRIYKNGSFVSGDQFINSIVSSDKGLVNGYVYLEKGDYLEIYVYAAGGYDINPNTSLDVQLAKSMYYDDNFSNYSKGPYIPVSAIVPDIKAIDLIKFIVNYFGCVATFDQYTSTLTINKSSLFKDSVDWSSYVKTYQIDYNNDVAQNNYIKFKDVDDNVIKSYNKISEIGYGNGNIEANRVKQERVISELPFGPAADIFNNNWNMQLPSVGLITLSQKDNFQFTSVTNDAGFAVLNGTFEGFSNSVDQLVYVQSSIYSGYYFITGASSTTIHLDALFISNVSGIVSTVQKDLTSSESRILLVNGMTNFSGISDLEGLKNEDGTLITDMPYCWFYKQQTGKDIDNYKDSLAINDLINANFGNRTISEAFYGKIKSAYQAPGLKTTMLLDEKTFQEFDFTKLVYLNTGDINGYFFVDSIINYKDSITPVQVNLIPESFKEESATTTSGGTYSMIAETGSYLITGSNMVISRNVSLNINIRAQNNTGLKCKIYYKVGSVGTWYIAAFGVIGPDFGTIVATTSYQNVNFPIGSVVDGDTIYFAIQNYSNQNVAFGVGNGAGYFGYCGESAPYSAGLSTALGTVYINVAASVGGYTTC